MSPAKPKHENRLAGETSPYLLQHAHNPVDWHPWGPEALARARDEQRPIFLSIGYSACHWCHVMERESFEDPQIAALMNEHFINVKVDREERPDLDDVYMKATQALTGQGGWPMSVWLTPDLEPFYAGTYFPPHGRWGRPGFAQVIENLAAAWRTNRAAVVEQAGKVKAVVERMTDGGDALPGAAPDARAPEVELVDAAIEQLAGSYDHRFGGFGGAPKFPHADDIRLLLRHHVAVGDHPALRMAEHTLDAMARGGIYDQLGGGFSRYSTDERWWIPHFEKMLYDNALLVPAYLEAYRITGRDDFARVARECCEWVLREMTGPEGGFHSTQDADSEGEEGRFFAWTRDEVLSVVGQQHGRLVDVAWNLGAAPNFEGRHVLVRPEPDAELARRLGMGVGELHAALEPLRAALFAHRERRVHPGTDDKVLVAWNGLMIGALAQASAVLGEPRFADAARRAADFCLTTMRPDGERLLATFRGGKAHLNGTLADYAYLASGLLDLFEADGDIRWPTEAAALVAVANARFADEEKGGYFFTSDDHEQLITRPRDLFDGAVPSSNGVMAEVLVRLGELTGDPAHTRRAERLFALVEPLARNSPSAFARLLLALMRAAGEGITVVVAGEGGGGGGGGGSGGDGDGSGGGKGDGGGHGDGGRGGTGDGAFRRMLARQPDASVTVASVPAGGVDAATARRFPLLAGKTARDGRATAYLCRRGTCTEPTTDVAALERQLA